RLMLLRLPPPPRSPRFPYTTLFRSEGLGARPRLHGDVGVAASAASARLVFTDRPPGKHAADRRAVAHDQRAVHQHMNDPLRELRDRKSTRLNSSHGSISYAVFCLKK